MAIQNLFSRDPRGTTHNYLINQHGKQFMKYVAHSDRHLPTNGREKESM